MAEGGRTGPWAGAGPGGEALLKAMFDAADVIAGVFELLDDDYRYVMANRNAAAFYGRPPGGLDGLCGRDLGLTDVQIQARLATLRGCWDSGEPRTEEYPFRLGETSGWFLGTFSPIAGERRWVSFVVLDVTERRLARAEAQRQSARLGLALDATSLGLWEFDIAADSVDWDARTRALFGVGDEPVDFATYVAAVHPEDLPMVEAAYRNALTGAGDGAYVVEHRTTAAGRDGSARWIRGAARVVFDARGRPRRVIGTAQDITAQVEARERQNLLLAELNHRVKNNLAAVQAIASQTLRSAADDPAAFQRAFESRLMSLARGHDLLTRTAWRTAEVGEVFDTALAPFSTQAIRINGGCGEVRVKPDLAVNLVMMLNELATNAGKYGALSAPRGEVVIDWSTEEDALVVDWKERNGPAVAPPQRDGFGSRLIRTALNPFGGVTDLSFAAEGVSCRMSVPLEGVD